MKLLIVWNIILTVLAGVAFANSIAQGPRSYDIAQDTVICGYITDLQIRNDADRTRLPNCQGDVATIFESLGK